jgi:hypothetical protein
MSVGLYISAGMYAEYVEDDVVVSAVIGIEALSSIRISPVANSRTSHLAAALHCRDFRQERSWICNSIMQSIIVGSDDIEQKTRSSGAIWVSETRQSARMCCVIIWIWDFSIVWLVVSTLTTWVKWNVSLLHLGGVCTNLPHILRPYYPTDSPLECLDIEAESLSRSLNLLLWGIAEETIDSTI